MWQSLQLNPLCCFRLYDCWKFRWEYFHDGGDLGDDGCKDYIRGIHILGVLNLQSHSHLPFLCHSAIIFCCELKMVSVVWKTLQFLFRHQNHEEWMFLFLHPRVCSLKIIPFEYFSFRVRLLCSYVWVWMSSVWVSTLFWCLLNL